MSDQPDYRKILLQLIGSLTLADHMGDASNDMDTALRMALPECVDEIDELEWEDLGEWLCKKHGVTTLHGTPLWEPEDDEERAAQDGGQ